MNEKKFYETCEKKEMEDPKDKKIEELENEVKSLQAKVDLYQHLYENLLKYKSAFQCLLEEIKSK